MTFGRNVTVRAKETQMSHEKEAEQAAVLDQEIRTDTRTWLSEDRGDSNSLDYIGEVRARVGMQERYADLDPMRDRDIEQRRR
jgi:hypothetical protein